MQRTCEWVKSWGMQQAIDTPQQLVNAEVQSVAHAAL
jgi:hypothetical protein